jgi:hypothetical protein
VTLGVVASMLVGALVGLARNELLRFGGCYCPIVLVDGRARQHAWAHFCREVSRRELQLVARSVAGHFNSVART